MVDFTIFDGSTGRVMRTGSAPENAVAAQPRSETEGITLGIYDTDEHYVSNGVPALRPGIGEVTVKAWGILFSDTPPEGTRVTITSRFYSDTVYITGTRLAFGFKDEVKIHIQPPWPFKEESVTLTVSNTTAPSGDAVQLISADISMMQTYYISAMTTQSISLADAMLGNPDAETLRRWKLKRSIRDRYLSGVQTTADDAAMAAAVQYSGSTVTDELERIAAKIAFEDWVTMRADGIRQEAARRINDANDVAGVLTAIEWAQVESEGAVAEAEARV